MTARPHQDLGPAVGVLILAVMVTALSLRFFVQNPEATDFRARYNEGTAWRHDQPLYQPNPSVNTHPPSVTWIFFGPLSRLPYPMAQAVSTGLNMTGVGLSLVLIARALVLTRYHVLWMVGLLLASQGMLQHWAAGQFIGLLMYPVTRSWLSFRKHRQVAAGLWLAPAIAMKPPLALLALLLPWPVWISAGVSSAALSAATLPFTGLAAWSIWLETGFAIDWVGRPFNASLWGLAARTQLGYSGDIGLSALQPVFTVAVLAALGAFAFDAVRQANKDGRFLLAGIWSVLASPLGWVYYLPLVVGPAVALWPASWTVIASYLMLQAPVGANTPDFGWLSGSLGCAGTLGLWFSFRRAIEVRDSAQSGR
jgi:hypothetical protein